MAYIVNLFSIKIGQPVIWSGRFFLSREHKLVFQSSLNFAHVAQSVEHFLGKEEVIGSNPIVGSRENEKMTMFSEKKEGLSHVEAEV